MNKNLLAVGIIILFILSALAPITFGSNVKTTNDKESQPAVTSDDGGSKTVIKVDDDGDGDYTSIQDAIDNATAGDTIEVYSGAYDDIITVDKQLTLMGIDSELGGGGGTGKPLLNVECGGDEEVIHVKVDGCSISGFHIDSPDYCLNGILVLSDNNDIYQNDVENTNFGINLGRALNNRVYENYIHGTHHGILINSRSYNNQIYRNYMDEMDRGIGLHNFAEYNTIFQNTVKGAYAEGIELSRSNNNTICENLIIDCDKGIMLWEDDEFGDGITIYGNNITSCDEGIMVTGKLHKIYQNNITNCKYGIRMEKIESIPPVQCCQNKVYENNVINSGETGIWLDGVYTSDIYRNTVTGSEIMGLLLEKAEVNNIFENNITYNDNGIYLTSSENNLIYHNNFIGNTDNAWCSGDPWDRRNKWNLGYTKDGGGNYWDDYKGKDRNGDNVGDKPYIIPDGDINPFNNDKDKYPLMEPGGRPNSKPYPVYRFHIIINRLLERFPLLERLLNVYFSQ